VLGSSADATAKLSLGKAARRLALEAGAETVGLKIPAKAKHGKQKLKLELVAATGAATTKSVTVTVN
jgi:hypothetical protein